MHKVAVMAAAMISALGGQPISGRRVYVAPQPEASKKFYLDRATAKRARKAASLNSQADRGNIGRVPAPVAVVEPVAPPKKPRARKTIGSVVQ